MDLTKLAIWISILSFVLAPALSIVANLITPKIERWWSMTTLARLERRITKLKAELDEWSRTWHFTPAEWEIRNTQLVVALAIYSAVLFGVLLIALNTVGVSATMVSQHVHLSSVLARPDAYEFLAVLCASFFLVIATFAWLEWKVGFPPFKSIHSPTASTELAAELEKLTKKAHEWQKRAVFA